MKGVRIGLIVLALTAARPVTAQSQSSLRGELALAVGHGHGQQYREAEYGGLRYALTLLIRPDSLPAMFVEVTAESFGTPMGQKLDCIMPPGSSTCIPDFPELSVFGATVGFIGGVGTRGELRAGIGVGVFSSQDRSFARVGGVLGELDAAFFPMSHFGVLAGLRPFAIPRVRGEMLWMVPITVGIRVR